MQADVIHGADFAVHVGDADRLVAAGELFGFVEGGEFGLRGELGEVNHVSCVMRANPCRASLGVDGRGRPSLHDLGHRRPQSFASLRMTAAGSRFAHAR